MFEAFILSLTYTQITCLMFLPENLGINQLGQGFSQLFSLTSILGQAVNE